MLKRKITKALENWKSTKNNQGLLVTGARQVGKTTSIEDFAKQHYESFIKIDFVESPQAARTISQARNLEDLITRITALAKRPLSGKSTLLFFDEIQKFEDSLTWMRYLANDERFDVIFSGSMLGVEVYNMRSLPVGTIDLIEMFPMDFEEFTWASGTDPSLWSTIKDCYVHRAEVPDFLHELFLELYAKYVLVGGMPEAVQTFFSTNDTQMTRARQKSILDTYRADITRYVKDPEHAQRIKTIYKAVPAQLSKEKKRFVVTGIDKNRRFENMASDFDWLENAGVTIPVRRCNDATYPLGISIERSFFKLYMNDVGLLFSTFSSADVISILDAAERINFGMAYENAVAQELRAHGHENLAYYYSNSTGEVDFLLEEKRAPEVYPLEVKSGKYSHKHAALNHLLNIDNYHFLKAIVMHRFNVSVEGDIIYLPIYMAGLIE